ncbi:MAG TPA: DUF5060 domain-containing protein [Verrucomicrobiota bacterium]|nr:DUF5060 domain-containing protein [Verrucomicrobiota bacterium]
MKPSLLLFTALLLAAEHATGAEAVTTAPQWQETELTFTSTRDAANPHTDTEAWADFTHDDGTKLRRPMFWDGGRTFRVRFASTKSSGTWRWTTSDRDGDPGLRGRSGTLAAGPAASEPPTIFMRHGFWSIPPGGRNLVHAEGLVVAEDKQPTQLHEGPMAVLERMALGDKAGLMGGIALARRGGIQQS